MPGPMQDQIEQAYAELAASQAAIADVQSRLDGSETSVTSKNRVITVTVNSRGDLVDIRFLSRSYRSMPSAELATLLVDTVGAARQQAQAAVAAAFAAVLPPGMPVLDMINGEADFESMMRDAIRLVNDPWPGADPPPSRPTGAAAADSGDGTGSRP
ncbi:YbaB/EbfC family nucleoid-associated protein [Micromonospora sp. NPDC049900]|uniref:YbaB/EbfC family nucleoid-associated protein n=1 Tax=unclassified Micromonospora TaxID=2617518 RepID=UPI00378E9D6B